MSMKPVVVRVVIVLFLLGFIAFAQYPGVFHVVLKNAEAGLHELDKYVAPFGQTKPFDLDNTEEWLGLVRKYVTLPVDRTYGSHVVPLLAAACVTDGNILEMGSGLYSTPMLSQIAKDNNRFILTADTDEQWLNKFKKYEASHHKLQHVPYNGTGKGTEWEDVGKGMNWSLVFLDQRPAYRRGVDLRKYRKEADLIVAHDTAKKNRKGYHYDNLLEQFSGHVVIQDYGAETTVVSDTNPELVAKVRRLVTLALNITKQ